MLTFLNWLFNFDIRRCLSYSERETVVHAKVDNSKLCCYFTEFGCFFLHNLHLDTQVGWFFDDFDRKAKDLSTVNLRILLQQFALSLRWAIIWQRENCMNLTKNNLITQEKNCVQFYQIFNLMWRNVIDQRSIIIVHIHWPGNYNWSTNYHVKNYIEIHFANRRW